MRFDKMSAEIEDAYKAENAVNSVKGLKGMLDLRVDANTAREYSGYNSNDPDLLESRARQTLKYQEIGGNAVLQARAEQGPNDPPLTAAREQQIAMTAIEEWAKANPEDWAYLFPAQSYLAHRQWLRLAFRLHLRLGQQGLYLSRWIRHHQQHRQRLSRTQQKARFIRLGS